MQREKIGKSRSQVAREIGVSPSGVLRWEAQDAMPDQRRELQVAAAYGLARNQLRAILGRPTLTDPAGDEEQARLSTLADIARRLSPARQTALIEMARLLESLE
jgi:transcriptional regulator with XRE-family HTH domain